PHVHSTSSTLSRSAPPRDPPSFPTRRSSDLGMGDRVCVDTCSLLADGEGMLVGNTSSAFLLVHPETLENPYVAPRPFRVNAGAVDRKSTRLNSSHVKISYAVFCL